MKTVSALLILAAVLAFASAEFLTAYDQCGGKGTKYTVPIPGKFTYDDITQLSANDKINYIELPPGYTITLYEGNIEDPQYRKQTFSSGQICLTGTALANVVSSWVVKADKPSTAVVEGYERCDANNLGQKWTFSAPGTVPFADINGAGANDRINFIRVPKGFKITLFEHNLNQGKTLTYGAGDHCLIGTPLQGLLSSFYTETVEVPAESFDRKHDELSGVYKLLSELEAKLAKQLQAANDDVSAKQAALNAASQAQNTAQNNYNTALSALNEAKRKTEAAQAALAQATDDRSKLIDAIKKELALIKKLKEIIGHHHCDDIVRGDNCYKVVKTSGVNFKAALDACNAWGGFPASIEDSEENAFIKSKLSTDCHSAWIGGTDENSEGKWRWLDGTKWNYSNWAPGEPNNVNNPGHRNGENYLEMYADSGLWNDITETFDNRAKCYVCKK